MRKLFISFSAIAVLLPVAYSVFALRGDNSTDAIVKLIGPGFQPTVCVKRAGPHFERMEPVMMEIVNAFLASEELTEVGFGLDRQNKPFLHIETTAGYRAPTDAEKDFYIPKFQSFGKLNYYSPGRFRRTEDSVVAHSNTTCGVPIVEWIRYRITQEWSQQLQNSPTANIAYINRPDGVGVLKKCVEPIGKPDPVIVCEEALSEYWVWYSEWWRPIDTKNQ